MNCVEERKPLQEYEANSLVSYDCQLVDTGHEKFVWQIHDLEVEM